FLDVVSIKAMPRIRYVGNRFFSRLARRAALFEGALDSHCGYTVIQRRALERLPLGELYDRYGFPTEMFFAARRADLKVDSVAVKTIYGDEVSGINPFTTIPTILFLIARSYLRIRFMRRAITRPFKPPPRNRPGITLRPENKPTLLILTSSFPRGPGDETCGYIRDFARSLSGEFNVEVLAPRDRKPVDWTTNEFRLRRSWSMLPVGFDPFTSDADLNQLIDKGICAKLATAISLACFFIHAFLLALRCDVICSQWLVPCGLIGAMISRITGRPHVAVEHSGAIHVLRRIRGGRGIVRFIVANSFHVITVSADLRRKLIALCAEAAAKTRVISMGVNVTDENFANDTSNNHPRSILFIGRLTGIKGLDVLLKALEGIDDVVLTIAGEGPLRRDLERMSRELSVSTSFAGHVTAAERQALLEKCDAVVIPSRELANGRCEGTPVVCLEAMAAGRLVTASRVGGLREVITDGHDGLLFDAEDHRMLGEKLMTALSDDSLRERIAMNGRRAIESYNWTAIGAKFIRILNDSLDNGPITHRQRRRATAG